MANQMFQNPNQLFRHQNQNVSYPNHFSQITTGKQTICLLIQIGIQFRTNRLQTNSKPDPAFETRSVLVLFYCYVCTVETSMARMKVLQPFAKVVVDCFQSCLADNALHLRGAIILTLHCGKQIVACI